MAKASHIQILFTKRNAPKNGPTSSAKYNDTISEISHDLTSISNQWNSSIVPLVNTLPDGTNDLDAFADGLSGTTIYAYPNATSTTNTQFYNNSKDRPSTVYEQFLTLYANIDLMKADLEGKIGQGNITADKVSIYDVAGLYIATTVEGALAEVKAEISLLDTLEVSNLVFLNGRAGGQDIHGGTAASEPLTLSSTTHLTKGKILFGDASTYKKQHKN